VALTKDIPDQLLRRGQVGTVVEALGSGHYEVEFSDDEGRTYAEASVNGEDLIVLHYQPQSA
jgi:hypothetical protein